MRHPTDADPLVVTQLAAAQEPRLRVGEAGERRAAAQRVALRLERLGGLQQALLARKERVARGVAAGRAQQLRARTYEVSASAWAAWLPSAAASAQQARRGCLVLRKPLLVSCKSRALLLAQPG